MNFYFLHKILKSTSLLHDTVTLKADTTKCASTIISNLVEDYNFLSLSVSLETFDNDLYALNFVLD